MFHFSFSNLKVSITGVSANEIPANMLLFVERETVGMADECSDSYNYTFSFVDTLPEPSSTWTKVYERYNLTVWRKGNLESRLLSVNSPDDAYALYEEQTENKAKVYFLRNVRADMNVDTVFLSCLALERRLVRENAFVLHCAFLAYKGGAVLFSGPSGIGKSTHAGIWCENVEGTHVVNGDRCLLVQNSDGTYEACGWPVCGSSQICHNEHYPLRAIVFVEQRETNALLPASPMELYKRLVSQITINHWDSETTSKALDSLMKLSFQVPHSVYGCNMNQDAPNSLKKWVDEHINKGEA